MQSASQDDLWLANKGKITGIRHANRIKPVGRQEIRWHKRKTLGDDIYRTATDGVPVCII
ncbi:hypothetical protein BHG07_15435 [Brenneria salicis ATCC 15712 = DSM 30166]|nr:hypothetical protein BHG07_15435 [Brenneria salicis ATCC 15712 = DSM 30166]